MADHLLTSFADEYNLNIVERMIDRLSAAGAMPHEQYCRMDGTDQYQTIMDRYSSFGTMGAWRDGEDIPLDIAVKQYDYTLTQVFYGLGFAVSRKFREYHRFNTVQEWADSLTDSSMQRIRTQHAYPLVNAFATVTYGDGKNLCATDHTASGSASRSNELASAAVYSVATWEALQLLGYRLTDYRGKSTPVQFDTVIVGPDQAPAARKIHQSELQAFTMDNQKNVHQGINVIVEDQLTSTTASFALKSDRSPLRSLWGKQPTPGTYRKNNGTDVFYIEADFVVGAPSWEGIAGTAGA